jgi:ATP synthase protein I
VPVAQKLVATSAMDKKLSRTPLEDLAERIQRLKAETQPAAVPGPGESMSGLGMAFAVAAHMVAGLGVGAAIGYFLDAWLGTSPWMLGLFFFLGAGAGVLNTYRMATGMGMAMGYAAAEDTARAGRAAVTTEGNGHLEKGGNSGKSA